MNENNTYEVVFTGLTADQARTLAYWYSGHGEQDADIWFNERGEGDAPVAGKIEDLGQQIRVHCL